MRNFTFGVLGAICLATLSNGGALASTANPAWNTLSGAAPIVIGHRGAAAYLPENTIGSNELAGDMGAQYVETDVMLTADGVVVVMHDLTLERTTNVEDFYAPRNGGYAVADFTWEEIQVLTAEPTGPASTTYPGFTPSDLDPYRVPSLAEMLDALTAYNDANGTDVGILTETKGSYSPETNTAVVDLLVAKGYTTAAKKSSLQSFDAENVAEMADLVAASGADMFIAQLGGASLVGEDWMTAGKTLEELAGYTDAVAIYYPQISADFISAAHALGLEVYGWTFRPGDLANAYDIMADFITAGLDGFITDNPDLVGSVLAASTPSAVPLPAALPMLAFGCAALGGLARRRKQSKAA